MPFPPSVSGLTLTLEMFCSIILEWFYFSVYSLLSSGTPIILNLVLFSPALYSFHFIFTRWPFLFPLACVIFSYYWLCAQWCIFYFFFLNYSFPPINSYIVILNCLSGFCSLLLYPLYLFFKVFLNQLSKEYLLFSLFESVDKYFPKISFYHLRWFFFLSAFFFVICF